MMTQDKTRRDKFIPLNSYKFGSMRNNDELDDTKLHVDNLLTHCNSMTSFSKYVTHQTSV